MMSHIGRAYTVTYNGDIKVYAAETRPRQQGAKLTAYEFMEDNIETTLITDGMIGTVFRDGRVDCCVVGADRILRTGHVINKIGTYKSCCSCN